MFRKLTTIVISSFVAVNAIFLVGVSLLSYKVFFDFTSNEISQTRLALLNENSERVSTFISTISDVGLYIAANRTITDIFSEKPASTYEAIQEQREITSLSNHVASLKHPIHSIEIYTDRFVDYPNISEGSVYPLEDLEKESWMSVFDFMDNGWVPKHTSLHHSQEMISYIHRLFDPKGIPVGFVKVNVVADTFFKHMGVEDLYEGVNEPLILLNAGGRIIMENGSSTYENVIEDITEKLPNEPFSVLIDSYKELTNHHQLLKIENEMYLLLISEPNYDQWRMVQLIPVASLFVKTKELGLVVILFGICAIIFSLPFVYWVGKKLSNRLERLLRG